MVRSSPSNLPVLLLLVGSLKCYLWFVFPPELRGIVAKALGGAATLCLIWLLVFHVKHTWQVLAVATWWTWEELQVVICSVAYAIEPWQVPEGVSICSARLDFDLGALGIIVVAGIVCILAMRPVRADRVNKKE